MLLLLFSAVLEVLGDTIVGFGLKSAMPGRLLLFVLGALTLFSYSFTVNSPPWEFGRLLGVYVVFFFIIAQLISTVLFHQAPSKRLLIGGVLIIFGGIIIATGDQSGIVKASYRVPSGKAQAKR